MTFPHRAGGQRAGVKEGELWSDTIFIGGSDPMQTEIGYIQASGTEMRISGTSAYFDSSVLSNDYYLPHASIGSPVSKEQVLIQAGSGATGAGSTAWLVFPTGFSEIPTVVAQISAVGANEDYTVIIGTIDEGSVQVYSIGAASQEFTWIAAGAP